MFLKYYARLMAGMFLVGTVVGAFRFRSVLTPWDVADWAVSLLSLVGLFGYVWRQQIFSRPFWMAFVPISLAWSLLYEVFFRNPAIFPWTAATRTPELIVVSIFLIPLYFALFRYAFSDAVARKNPAAQATQAT